ncbi:MAG: ankyrin repeat domain-containing protein [Waddliaceae bacterium]
MTSLGSTSSALGEHCLSPLSAYSYSALSPEQWSALLPSLTPATLPYTDLQGRTIQLWEDQQTFFASIEENHTTHRLPGGNIYNGLQENERGASLLHRLEESGLKRWHLAFIREKRKIVVWPFLIAAGKNRSKTSKRQTQADNRKPQFRYRDVDAAWKEAKKEIINTRPGGAGDEIRLARTALNHVIEKLKDDLKNHHLGPQERLRLTKMLAEAARLAAGNRKSLPYTPAFKDFAQQLQQINLIESCQSHHRSSLFPLQGETREDIDGAACRADYIKGLFESPETLFEREHIFCLPLNTAKKLPFSEGELHQLCHELEIGIVDHRTLPSCSLRFRKKNADFFSVIPPVYKNTLVGRVMGILGYFMRSYLNGAVFSESFIDRWHQDPSWKKQSSSACRELIDLERYCKENLKDQDQQYQSLRSLLDNLLDDEALMKIGRFMSAEKFEKLKQSLAGESAPFSLFEGFRVSFHLIAKQKSFKKTGNVFDIDAGFEAVYKLEPLPETNRELTMERRTYGEPPILQQIRRQVCRVMAEDIHALIIELPFLRKYSSMMSFISFFSGYLSTLGKHRKRPVFPPVKRKAETLGCPPFFPHPPLKSYAKETLRYHPASVMKKLVKVHYHRIMSHASKAFDLLAQGKSIEKSKRLKEPKTRQLLQAIADVVKETTFGLCSAPFRRSLLESDEDDKIALNLRFRKEAENIFDQLSKLLVLTVEQFKEVPAFKRVSKNEQLSRFMTALKSGGSDEEEFMKEISYLATRLPSELPFEVREKNKGIAGGCGLLLQGQKLQPSHEASFLLRRNWKALQELTPGSWMPVKMPNGQECAVFRLLLEDIPSWITGDHAWTETTLPSTDEEYEGIREQHLVIQEAMDQRNHEAFAERVEEADAARLKNIRDEYGACLLCQAAKIDDPIYSETLLQKGLSPSSEDVDGYRPIHYASMNGCVDNLGLFITADPKSVHAQSKNGSSPLTVAIQHSQIPAIRVLLEENPRPFLLTSGDTDLHCALQTGNREVIDLVLSCKTIVSICINISSEEGGTPLILACRLDDPKIVRQLLDLKADPDALLRNGFAAVDIAIIRQCVPVLEALLERAKVSPRSVELAVEGGHGGIVKAILEKHPHFVEHRNACGDNLAHMALRQGHLSLALDLAKSNPHLFAKPNVEGAAPLHLALALGAWELVEELWEKGVKPNFHDLLQAGEHPIIEKMFRECDELSEDELQGYLLTAAQAGSNRMISQVLEPMGAKVEQLQGPLGWTAVHYFAKSDALSLFKREISRTHDLLSRLPEEGNQTLPHLAAEKGSTGVFFFLLEQMKVQNIPFHDHFHDHSLLYPLFEKGDVEAVNRVLEMFPEWDLVNEPLDSQGTLPAHAAARMGRKSLLQLLTEKQAHFDRENRQGHAPLYYAVRLRDPASVAAILNTPVRIRPEELYKAAIQNDETILNQLIGVGPPDEILNHALCLAVFRHKTDACLRLHRNGASFHAITAEGWTPTLYASASGQQDLLTIILKEHLIDQRCFQGDNALHLACRRGHYYCVQLLLDAGFSHDQPNQQGKTPLELAAHTHITQKMLKQQKACDHQDLSALISALEEHDVGTAVGVLSTLDPLETISVDDDGAMIWGPPLLVAMWLCHKKSVKQAILEKALPLPPGSNPVDHRGNTLAHLLVNGGISPFELAPIDFKARNHAGRALLHLGAGQDDSALFAQLLERAPHEEIDGEDNEGLTPIFYALLHRREAHVRLLADYGADLHHYTHQLFTPLLLACQQGSSSSLKILQEQGVDLDQEGTHDHLSPLTMAIAHKRLELACDLLFHGAAVAVSKGKEAHPIHSAADLGNTRLLRLLAAKGVPLDLEDEKGMQPVHYAALHGHIPVLETLFGFQSDLIDVPVGQAANLNEGDEQTPQQFEGAAPLLLATYGNHPQTVEWLLRHGVNPEARTQQGKDVLSLAAEANAGKSIFSLLALLNLSHHPHNILPAIVGAIRHDNAETMISLYEKKMPIDADFIEGFNGLQLASYFGASACTGWLLQHGADPFRENRLQQDAFNIAAENPSYEQLRLLLDYTQQNPNHVNRARRSLLHLAAAKGNYNHVLLLLQRRADKNCVDDHRLTPLHDAVQNDRFYVVHLLLSCGADASIAAENGKLPKDLANSQEMQNLFKEYETIRNQAERGETDLHLAAKMRNPIAVLLLLGVCDANQGDENGTTPLHIAVGRGLIEIVLHLVRAGGNPNAPDKSGITPLKLAKQAEDRVKEELLDILTSKSMPKTGKDWHLRYAEDEIKC